MKRPLWGYKCHKFLMTPLWFIITLLRAIDVYSWGWAHYKNNPIFKREMKHTSWKDAWYSGKNDY